MFVKDGKRFNVHAPQEINDVRYVNFLDASLRTHFGITEIPDPLPPADYDAELYYVNETNEAPYVIYTKKSQEQIDEVLLRRAKQARTAAVEALTVTTQSGKIFDGNEEAQGRMARAICVMIEGETTNWVLANNTVAVVTYGELKEALKLAGAAQTDLWMVPYA